MKPVKSKIDRCIIHNASYQSKNYVKKYIELGEKLKTDPDKKNRLDVHECMSCFYIFHGRVGGSMMTDAECGICGKIMHFSNTCVDKLCDECANKYQLCKRCGSDIQARVRRNVDLPAQPDAQAGGEL
jgi:hypothetical protein